MESSLLELFAYSLYILLFILLHSSFVLPGQIVVVFCCLQIISLFVLYLSFWFYQVVCLCSKPLYWCYPFYISKLLLCIILYTSFGFLPFTFCLCKALFNDFSYLFKVILVYCLNIAGFISYLQSIFHFIMPGVSLLTFIWMMFITSWWPEPK